MRKLEEKRELLYVIRTMDVLMSSGVGLEAAIHTIGRGGYGIISEDFSDIMKRLRKGTGGGLDKELKSLMKKADSPGYQRHPKHGLGRDPQKARRSHGRGTLRRG